MNVSQQEKVMKAGVEALKSTYNTTFTYGSIANVLCKSIISYHCRIVATLLDSHIFNRVVKNTLKLIQID